mmetsp:Transcript_46429/g.135240  ORF Transcript_46429/g.135240 Transcript_46429/m.135240 type:complete len:658 (-) Transcript_46429:72-2045(-)
MSEISNVSCLSLGRRRVVADDRPVALKQILLPRCEFRCLARCATEGVRGRLSSGRGRIRLRGTGRRPLQRSVRRNVLVYRQRRVASLDRSGMVLGAGNCPQILHIRLLLGVETEIAVSHVDCRRDMILLAIPLVILLLSNTPKRRTSACLGGSRRRRCVGHLLRIALLLIRGTLCDARQVLRGGRTIRWRTDGLDPVWESEAACDLGAMRQIVDQSAQAFARTGAPFSNADAEADQFLGIEAAPQFADQVVNLLVGDIISGWCSCHASRRRCRRLLSRVARRQGRLLGGTFGRRRVRGCLDFAGLSALAAFLLLWLLLRVIALVFLVLLLLLGAVGKAGDGARRRLLFARRRLLFGLIRLGLPAARVSVTHGLDQRHQVVLVDHGLLGVGRRAEELLEQHGHNDVDQDHDIQEYEADVEKGHGEVGHQAGRLHRRPRKAFGPRVAGEDLQHGVQRLREVPEVLVAVILASGRQKLGLVALGIDERAARAEADEDLASDDGVDTHDNYQDDEGVEHAGDGAEQGCPDLPQGLDPLEEAEDTEGAHHAEQGQRAKVEVQGCEDPDRNHDEIENVPSGPPELCEPKGVHVKGEFEGEANVEKVLKTRKDALVLGSSRVNGRLRDVRQEVARDENGDGNLCHRVPIYPDRRLLVSPNPGAA